MSSLLRIRRPTWSSCEVTVSTLKALKFKRKRATSFPRTNILWVSSSPHLLSSGTIPRRTKTSSNTLILISNRTKRSFESSSETTLRPTNTSPHSFKPTLIDLILLLWVVIERLNSLGRCLLLHFQLRRRLLVLLLELTRVQLFRLKEVQVVLQFVAR